MIDEAGAREVVGEPDEVEHEADARLELGAEHGHGREPDPARGRPPRALGRRGTRRVRLPTAARRRRRRPSGPARRPAPRRPPATRPSAARTPRPRRCGPSSGLSTSLATTTRVSASAGCRPERSSRARSASAAPPGRSSCPSASRSRAPSACSIPAPPSVLALPPMPSTISRQPWSSAARTTSPVPYELAPSASSRSGISSASPDTSAISTTATPSRAANAVVTGSPVGPCARTGDPRVPGGDGGVERAVAAVGHRHLHDLDARRLGADPRRHPRGDLPRGQRSLELVRSHQDAHGSVKQGDGRRRVLVERRRAPRTPRRCPARCPSRCS